MSKRLLYISTTLLIIGYVSCKKVYNAQLVSVATNFLAVDGNIISGDSTFITLSRTTSLSDAVQNKVELKAIVSIENDQGTLYPLTEKGKGVYVRGVTTLDPARKYRLNIKTADTKVYQSDFVPMKVTPPIDSIYIRKTAADELTYYADTHDANNDTRYYRWEYTDTWKYVPVFTASYKYKNGVVTAIEKNSPDDITNCYGTSNSTEILIGSSAKITQDIIQKQRIGAIHESSQKIAYYYVIQLRQYALTKEAFEYYQNLRANTEQLGSIFDAQPSMLSGNIHCITRPTDLVLGFINASTITRKQINIDAFDYKLMAPTANRGIDYVNQYGYPRPNYEYECSQGPYDDKGQGSPWSFGGPRPIFLPITLQGSVKTRADRSLASGDSILYYISGGSYWYAPKACVDCRLKGGTNIRPAYYPPF